MRRLAFGERSSGVEPATYRRSFLGALVSFAVACGERDERNISSRWVEELVGISAELRRRVGEHGSSVRPAKGESTSVDPHEEDGAALLTLTDDMVLALYGLESCSKEGRLKQTPFLSDVVGRIDFEIRSHVHPSSEVQQERTLDEAEFEENMLELLDELDHRLEQARVESARLPIDDEPCVLPYHEA